MDNIDTVSEIRRLVSNISPKDPSEQKLVSGLKMALAHFDSRTARKNRPKLPAGRPPLRRDAAVELLKAALVNGTIRSEDLKLMVAKAGYSHVTMNRAKRALDTIAYKRSGVWYICLREFRYWNHAVPTPAAPTSPPSPAVPAAQTGTSPSSPASLG